MEGTRPFAVPLSIILGLLVLAAMLVSVPAFPATYVVDPAGNDAGVGDGTAPWRTVQHAAAVAAAGDHVVIHAGTYAESVVLSHSGTAEAPIVFSADPGAVLVSPDPSASEEAFNVAAGTGYVSLVGIEATGGFDETIFLRSGAHDITISECNLHDNRSGIIMGGASNITVDHCRMHHNGRLGIRFAAGTHDVSVTDTDSFMNGDGAQCSSVVDGFAAETDSSALTFTRVHAYDNGGDGFDLQGDQVTLNDVASTGNACTGFKLYQNAVVRGCLVSSNARGIAVSSLIGGTAVDIGQCTVAANNGVAVDLTSPYLLGAAFTVHIHDSILSGDFKLIQYVRNATLYEDHDILFRSSPYDQVIAPIGGRAIIGHDVNLGRWARRPHEGAGTLAVDPLFVDAANGDYHVAATSAAVGRGTLAAGSSLSNIGFYQDPVGPTNHSPWADAGRNRTSRVNRKLRFVATGSVDPDGDALSYSWDFGDGSLPVEGLRASHKFTAPGIFAVTLTVSDGVLSGRATVLVTILDRILSL